jgi:hypothetical protein
LAERRQSKEEHQWEIITDQVMLVKRRRSYKELGGIRRSQSNRFREPVPL